MKKVRFGRMMVVVGIFALLAVVLSSCSDIGGVERMAGKGAIPSTVRGTAVFGFVFDGPSSKVEGTYLDRSDGVMFTFTGVVDYLEPITGDEECMDAELTYKSLSGRSRGTGIVSIVACDIQAGQGSSADSLDVRVRSGPFSDYSNFGPVRGTFASSGSRTGGAIAAQHPPSRRV